MGIYSLQWLFYKSNKTHLQVSTCYKHKLCWKNTRKSWKSRVNFFKRFPNIPHVYNRKYRHDKCVSLLEQKSFISACSIPSNVMDSPPIDSKRGGGVGKRPWERGCLRAPRCLNNMIPWHQVWTRSCTSVNLLYILYWFSQPRLRTYSSSLCRFNHSVYIVSPGTSILPCVSPKGLSQ